MQLEIYSLQIKACSDSVSVTSREIREVYIKSKQHNLEIQCETPFRYNITWNLNQSFSPKMSPKESLGKNMILTKLTSTSVSEMYVFILFVSLSTSSGSRTSFLTKRKIDYLWVGKEDEKVPKTRYEKWQKKSEDGALRLLLFFGKTNELSQHCSKEKLFIVIHITTLTSPLYIFHESNKTLKAIPMKNLVT